MNPSEMKLTEDGNSMDELLTDKDKIGKKIGNMKLFETYVVDSSGSRALTRVMGGWIYEMWDAGVGRRCPVSCCFIPFNSEFYPAIKR
jgi:hypothetical protein